LLIRSHVFYFHLSFYIKKYLVQISYLLSTDNLADMGTAKQSSSYKGFNAAKALDGNRNQDWYGYSCGHTAEGQTEAWWRLDIGQRANIYNIVIYYRENRKYKMCVTRSTIVSLFLQYTVYDIIKCLALPYSSSSKSNLNCMRRCFLEKP
jgi:hypothetical protein